MNSKKIKLEAARVRYCSVYDEAAFFEWLNKLPSVCDIEGISSSIYITVDYEDITEEDLRELLSVFSRYGISMGQLIAFDRLEFSGWFRDERAYWFSHVFGEPQQER